MDEKAEELTAVIAEIQRRVRARNPNGVAPGDIPLVDLNPLLHARDAADAKVASIGTVNPRPPGFANNIAQSIKRLVARALDWHVREQVEFNRAVMNCVQSTLESLNDFNRSVAALSIKFAQFQNEFHSETQQLKDVRIHWSEWRIGWEQRLTATEIQFLRSVSELQASFQHRVTLMDASHRDQMQSQHRDFEGALAHAIDEMHGRLFDQIREQYEGIIYNELRLLRQKAALAKTTNDLARTIPADFANIDWLKFADRFRGSEAAILERQRTYTARFRDHSPILDLGCGRGEMLEAFRDAGIQARGVDLNDESIAICLSKHLDVEKADLFDYLDALPNASLGGAVSCQVVEHLPPERLPEMIHLLKQKLRPGAPVAIETPNPECLAIFATHFYLDPTHRHPIPPMLLSFYLEEAGFGRIEVEKLSPAIDSMPSLSELPEPFRNQFFGALDYAVFATRLA